MSTVRVSAARAIAAVLQRHATLDDAMEQASGALEGRDRALLREIAYGVCRRYFELDGILAQLLKQPLKERDTDVRAVLLSGLYQLRHMRVPPHAAVAESVNACRGLGKNWACGVVNAVLRAAIARNDALERALSAAAASAHPLWLHEAIQREWPFAAPSILAANNAHPPMVVRVNRQKIARDAWQALAVGANLGPTPGRWSADAVILDHGVDVRALPGFAEGMVSVQDEAAQLAVPLLGVGDGERVLDACAAPGGKAGHLLECAPHATLVALDSNARRLERVHENLLRLGLLATVRTGDASEPQGWWDGEPFDRILVDAPCSATGIIRRHPDIKVLRSADQVRASARQQQRILSGLWPTLRPGGTLLYCTCSILGAENDDTIGAFLDKTTDARCERIEADWGEAMRFGRQLLPSSDGPDGFYYARVRKTHGL